MYEFKKHLQTMQRKTLTKLLKKTKNLRLVENEGLSED